MDDLKKVFMLLLTIGVVSLGLMGCDDAEKEKAIAEAAEAKVELRKVKAELADTITERDTAESKATRLQTMVDKLTSQSTEQTQKVTDIEGNNKTLQEKIVALTQGRDSAIANATSGQAIVEKLKSQLAEQAQKITGLEVKNMDLQNLIDELKKKLSGKIEMPPIPKL